MRSVLFSAGIHAVFASSSVFTPRDAARDAAVWQVVGGHSVLL